MIYDDAVKRELAIAQQAGYVGEALKRRVAAAFDVASMSTFEVNDLVDAFKEYIDDPAAKAAKKAATTRQPKLFV